MTRTGVLLTAFGGPASLEEVGPFMTRLMGRAPSEQAIEGAKRKYEAIGGRSPLPQIAREIAEGLEIVLAERGAPMLVRLGMRYAEPSIADAVAVLVGKGAPTIATVSLSPFESRITTGAYRDAVAEAVAGEGVEVLEAPTYHDHEGFVGFFADAASRALETLAAEPGAGRLFMVFTAHSLPMDDPSECETYVSQIRETTTAVVGRMGLGALEGDGDPSQDVPWALAYQSRGRRECEWLGPDVGEVIQTVAGQGFCGIAVCPLGFVTDHMETLYDLDVVMKGDAQAAGLAFARADVPNAHPLMIEVLADTVLSALPG